MTDTPPGQLLRQPLPAAEQLDDGSAIVYGVLHYHTSSSAGPSLCSRLRWPVRLVDTEPVIQRQIACARRRWEICRKGASLHKQAMLT